MRNSRADPARARGAAGRPHGRRRPSARPRPTRSGPAVLPGRHRRPCRRTSASTTRGTASSASRDSAERIAAHEGRAAQAPQPRAAAGVPLRLHPDRDRLDQAGRHTSVYVLPGYYTESRWANAKRTDYCSHLSQPVQGPAGRAAEYIGSLSSRPGTRGRTRKSDPIALSYADQRALPHNLNLIAIMGDRRPTTTRSTATACCAAPSWSAPAPPRAPS